MFMPKKPIDDAGTPHSYLSLLFHAVFPTAEVVRVMAQSAFQSACVWTRGKTASPLRAPMTIQQPRL